MDLELRREGDVLGSLQSGQPLRAAAALAAAPRGDHREGPRVRHGDRGGRPRPGPAPRPRTRWWPRRWATRSARPTSTRSDPGGPYVALCRTLCLVSHLEPDPRTRPGRCGSASRCAAARTGCDRVAACRRHGRGADDGVAACRRRGRGADDGVAACRRCGRVPTTACRGAGGVAGVPARPSRCRPVAPRAWCRTPSRTRTPGPAGAAASLPVRQHGRSVTPRRRRAGPPPNRLRPATALGPRRPAPPVRCAACGSRPRGPGGPARCGRGRTRPGARRRCPSRAPWSAA